MPKVVFDQERCKGCGLCVAVCPVKIISISQHINWQGYRPAGVNQQEKCTACTLCGRVCPDTVIEVYK
jgi:2-oxoglutarate ferredoxin oxidoreductase subunit delta